MPLSIGARLGPYEIIAAIGAGGMGEVWRARDTLLNRDVAIKILPEAFAADAERLARFKREAQVLASLNHSSIASIYGLEESGGSRALVMELVEGADLSQRLARGALALDETLPMARQIADALEAAHEQGIVHRDLKPANIKIKADGTVKVLDFGLAKALGPEGASPVSGNASSPTITTPAMTEAGIILGTASYMAPEQARGKRVDKRADIWAFGVVLFEMLTGQRAFGGETISDVLAKVIEREPDWAALPAATPGSVRELLRRCLKKDPKARLRDIGEARVRIDAVLSGTAEDTAAIPMMTAAPWWRRAMPVAVVAVVAAALVGTAAWHLKPTPQLIVSVSRSVFSVPGQEFSGAGRHMVAISPNGELMVYAASGRLFLRAMSEFSATPIPGTEGFGNVTTPTFSPDGRTIAFHAASDQTIKTISVAGGAAQTICEGVRGIFGMSWAAADGTILFGQGRDGIMRVKAGSPEPERVIAVKQGEIAQSPQLLPGGSRVLFTLASASETGLDRWDKAQIVVQALGSSERTVVIAGGSDGRYLPTGDLVYALGGRLFSRSFDPRRLKTSGDPIAVIDGVRRATSQSTGAAQFSVSDSGTLIYVPGPVHASGAGVELELRDLKGGPERLNLSAGPHETPRASPDGTRIAYVTDDGRATISIYDLSTKRRFTLTDVGNNRFPVWSRDGKRIAFQSDRHGDFGIYWQATDAGSTADLLTTAEPGTSHVPESWSPTEDTLLFSAGNGTSFELRALSLPNGNHRQFVSERSQRPFGAAFSSDGRFVAYSVSSPPGSQLYVQPYPTGTPQKALLDSGTAANPLWSADGTEIFFNPRAGGLHAIPVNTHPTVTFGEPRPVLPPVLQRSSERTRQFDLIRQGAFNGWLVRLVPEGEGFETGTGVQIRVVLNWFEELKR